MKNTGRYPDAQPLIMVLPFLTDVTQRPQTIERHPKYAKKKADKGVCDEAVIDGEWYC